MQLPFNLFDNINIRGNLINQLKNRGKIIHTRSVFLQGLFFKKPNDLNLIVQTLHSQFEILTELTLKLGCKIEELALSYCMSQEKIDNVIIGVDSVDQLIFNLKASTYPLTAESINRINNIKVQNLDFLNPALWNLK